MPVRFLVLSALLLAIPAVALSQEPAGQSAAAPVVAPVQAGVAAEPAPVDSAAQKPAINLQAPFAQSFLFTPAELMAIRKAMEGTVAGTAILSADQATVIPERRVISVSGVVWRGYGDWVVWLNGQKVTPKNLLPEIVDIQVNDNSKVHLKWFDIGLNDVISITIRPHQTYDIVTGVMLPG